MRVALYQPDIAGNTGTIIRLAACFGVPVDIIEPCGFPFSDRQLKRAAMDYAKAAQIVRRPNFEAFAQAMQEGGHRIVLLTSKGDVRLPDAEFQVGDVLLLGSESAGVPDDVHQYAGLRIRIPMQIGLRSLNIAVAAGIALGEALRQKGLYPP
ncbi:tRNA (cytidine(34)-2'-O)-methyltransferase [Rhizorhapis suberifaciens]|uniref:tRNA (cytidine(34)-2'-O)-methyltransferase n=1 Tax=Rhizorhapis suberifaciens TaxID=13656 RepID=A0A840HRU1_9SPHN|nr:tRNA (cytidine(34)-2'-O)-methyltransferase [Rhizorhapis suberifaciens]MBB4640254.1 tRNA (cytidine/uridine-2'-O-)-methyltransferase [Rhizorhapis suberifaciens]